MTKRLIYAILTILFIASCTSDDDPSLSRDKGSEGNILFGRMSSVDGLEWKNGRTATRAFGDEVKSTTPRNMGVFAFGNGQNTTYIFRNQKVYWEDGADFNNRFAWDYSATSKWPYTTEDDEKSSVQKPWDKMRYCFFAYSPWYETSNVRVEGENYSTFNTFIWDNIPGFSADDYILANNIIHVDNTQGNNTPIVHFGMRHILSRIRFFFKMSPAYRELRTIEIDSLTVLTAGRVKTATFNFKNNEWDETVHWSNEQIGNATPVILVNSDTEHYFVPTSYPDKDHPYTSVYVYPQAKFNLLKLRVSYTVYDTKDLTTRHAKLINELSLPNWTLLSGYYYDIFINIVPAFLYVLSDNDQDFDGYVVIKDNP